MRKPDTEPGECAAPSWSWILQPQSSLQVMTAPADISTETFGENLNYNHPAKPLPDSRLTEIM